MLSVRC